MQISTFLSALIANFVDSSGSFYLTKRTVMYVISGDSHYVTKEELKQYQKGEFSASDNEEDRRRALEIQQFIEEDSYLNLPKITRKQLKETSQLFKEENPDITLSRVLDRGFDGNDYFNFIDKELEDEFVIRMKASRDSNEFRIYEKSLDALDSIFQTLIDAIAVMGLRQKISQIVEVNQCLSP